MLLFNNYHTSYLEDTCPKEDVAKKVQFTPPRLTCQGNLITVALCSLASHEATLIVLTQYDLKDVLLAKIKQEYSVTDKNLVKVTHIIEHSRYDAGFPTLIHAKNNSDKILKHHDSYYVKYRIQIVLLHVCLFDDKGNWRYYQVR